MLPRRKGSTAISEAVDIEIRRRAKPLNERDRAGVGSTAFKPRLLEQETGDDPVCDA
jgi:hypothetical protein